MPGTVLAVAGCKGGVGKTTTSINLGTAATATDRNVLVVETDLAMANVSDFVDIDVDPEEGPTLHDVLVRDTPISEAIYRTRSGLCVLPSGTTLEGYGETDLDRLQGVVREARNRFGLVLLDTPAGVSRETLLSMGLADGVIVVATPRVSSVRDAKKSIELVRRVNSSVVGLVLTHTGSGTHPPGEEIASFLDVDLLGTVPEDEAVPRSQDAGRAVVSHAPQSPPARAYRDVFDRLMDRFALSGHHSPGGGSELGTP